jgi:hypothetical protein
MSLSKKEEVNGGSRKLSNEKILNLHSSLSFIPGHTLIK